MRRLSLIILVIGLFVPIVFAAAPAHAQATRTWVSGVGDDANPCSRTAPCKTFAGAISKTAAGGEINCIDPGGFGALTITKAITIDCTSIPAGVLVAGTNGFNVSAGAADVVQIRGLNFDGVLGSPSPAGLVGIRITGAAVVSIEKCLIYGFSTAGIQDVRTSGQTRLLVHDTVIRHNSGPGIVTTATGVNGVVLNNVVSENNTFGIALGSTNNVEIVRSVFFNNSNAGVEVDSGAQVNVTSSVISHNNIGVQNGGTAWVSDSSIGFNNNAIQGTVTTFGNNRLTGNVALGGTFVAAGASSTDLGQQ